MAKILYIDAGESQRESVKRLFERQHEITCVAGIDEAISKIRFSKFDVIITDDLIPSGATDRSLANSPGAKFLMHEITRDIPWRVVSSTMLENIEEFAGDYWQIDKLKQFEFRQIIIDAEKLGAFAPTGQKGMPPSR